MPVPVSVKDVRAALLRAASQAEVGPGDGEPGTLLLGTLFHAVFADLVSGDPRRSGVKVVVESGEDREVALERLTTHLYEALVGPRLKQHQAQLQETAAQVLTFWEAAKQLARWLTALVQEVLRKEESLPGWEAIAGRIAAEKDLACELRQPGWADSVLLTGTADSLFRRADGQWCALELKLGRARPAVDLGQAALYRLIAARQWRQEGPLALLRFAPEATEVLVTAAQVAEAEAKLVDLIGAIAGVKRATTEGPRDARVIEEPPRPDRHAELAKAIVRAYREYGPTIELPEPPAEGPRFLRFPARLGRGVTLAQLTRFTAEVGIRAGLATEPIITTEGGRLAIDVARPDPQVVPFAKVRAELAKATGGASRLPVGVDVGGTLVCADLASPNHAHLLVAGSAGSGKSEWLRMAIAGLMVSNTRDTLRLVLVDPKLSAFMDLKGSPWLFTPRAFWVPGEGRDVVELLDELVEEMNRRYEVLAQARCDDLQTYRATTGKPMPRVVLFCDEYFALISGDSKARKEVEGRIAVLAAKGRASGMHLVIATQQASREVVKGTLDANLSCRVGLRVPKALESQMLLGQKGAERLTGNGDLLYRAIGDPVRLQAPYLDPEERRQLFTG